MAFEMTRRGFLGAMATLAAAAAMPKALTILEPKVIAIPEPVLPTLTIYNGPIKQFTLSYTREMLDTTTFGDNTRRYMPMRRTHAYVDCTIQDEQFPFVVHEAWEEQQIFGFDLPNGVTVYTVPTSVTIELPNENSHMWPYEETIPSVQFYGRPLAVRYPDNRRVLFSHDAEQNHPGSSVNGVVMRILVIGGGMVGRLVQFLVPDAEILEIRPAPDMTGTVLRPFGAFYLWRPLPGLPCEPINITTHIDAAPATAASMRLYKRKVGKDRESDVSWESQFKEKQIGYSLISFPPEGPVRYNTQVERIWVDKKCIETRDGATLLYDVLVSTIPLPLLMQLCRIVPEVRLQSASIYIQVFPAKLPWDGRAAKPGMYVNYLTDSHLDTYRVTRRPGPDGDEYHYESLVEPKKDREYKRITPGKIYDNVRTKGWVATLAAKDIYCFGRYATWDSNELTHDSFERIMAWKDKLVRVA